MQGEVPEEVTLDASGVVGDRAYALVDHETGVVASAKDPRRWAGLLAFSARYADEPGAGRPVTITLPGGAQVSSADPDVDARLSAAVGRPVTLSASPSSGAVYDGCGQTSTASLPLGSSPRCQRRGGPPPARL